MIIPGVQKPHWVAKPSRNACWIGASVPSCAATPSSVFTVEPLTVSTGTRQDITASPSSRHVQVPHVPTPQPRLAAVRPSVSRRALSRVVPGLAMNSCGSPLTSISMTLDGIGQGSTDVDRQDTAAVPGTGEGVVEGVGGLHGQVGGAVDVAAGEGFLGSGRANGGGGDAAEGDPGAVGRHGDDRGRVLPPAHGL